MSFRASHYFVSYISEATATAAGLGGTGDRRGDWSGIQVAHPHDVEIPRSLKEVAKAWSRPWHLFLKDCECTVLLCNDVSGKVCTHSFG